jgi:hypothetical protein
MKGNMNSFKADKLTHSIENVVSGDSFPTEISPITKVDLKQVTKKHGWNFNWSGESQNAARYVCKLTIIQNPSIIQGLISFSIEQDHVFMHLLESAPFNVGKNKVYNGVPGNLVAYACKISFLNGLDGYVGFTSKTTLIAHYEKTLRAVHVGGQRMVIFPKEAHFLINKYFKKE